MNIEHVFRTVRKNGLQLQANKCNLFKAEDRYHGPVVSQKGVSADPEKQEGVEDGQHAKNRNAGMLIPGNRTRHFIAGVAKFAALLHASLAGSR